MLNFARKKNRHMFVYIVQAFGMEGGSWTRLDVRGRGSLTHPTYRDCFRRLLVVEPRLSRRASCVASRFLSSGSAGQSPCLQEGSPSAQEIVQYIARTGDFWRAWLVNPPPPTRHTLWLPKPHWRRSRRQGY